MTRITPFLLLFLLCQVCPAETVTPPKPNVVMILADDLGWVDLACYGSKFLPDPAHRRARQAGHALYRSLLGHLLAYALGRKLELADQPAVAEIQRAAAADGHRFSRIVTEIVKAYPFGHVRDLKATVP